MGTGVVLFTSDLRVHDNPTLTTVIADADTVVPLFVLDDTILRSRFATPNRVGFLLESLRDLRSTLRRRGGDLVVRRGDTAGQVARLAEAVDAETVHVAGGVSKFARSREEQIGRALVRRKLVVCDGTTIVAPDELKPYKVFTPYWRVWRHAPRRRIERAPSSVRLPDGVRVGEIPGLSELVRGTRAPDVIPGGETEARRRFNSWGRSTLKRYEDVHDDLAGDDTSKLGAALHFGCLSPLEIEARFADRPGGEAFVRQLCWRDFHHQTVWSFPAVTSQDLRPRRRHWRGRGRRLEAWTTGRTGVPIVDAGMRQLLAEGWMHNRTRMLTASFLTKQLGVDWRLGARFFMDHLVDGDIANNYANWQWVAGTGADTRPNRIFNPIRQARRFDPDGSYVRRYVPGLANVEGSAVHEPWRLSDDRRRSLDYPAPIVDHEAAAEAFRRAGR